MPQQTAPAEVASAQADKFAIDAHAHVFHRKLTLADGRRYSPGYDAPLDLYLRRLDENGIARGVLVQPSFLGTDNSYLVDSIAAAGGRLRGIAVVDPSVSPQWLRQLDQAGIVGIRLNLVGGLVPDVTSQPWRGLLAEVVRLRWQIEVQHRASELAQLVPRLLDTGADVVLDHFALPDAGLGVADPGFAAILKLGASRRLWVKVSAPYRLGPDGERIARDAFPLLRDALGLDRLVWGSDWPHTQFEASQSYRSSRAFLDRLIPDQDERAGVLRSPRTLFRF
jgi:predicted TIM-barrel fold metal-dependent hydrolase